VGGKSASCICGVLRLAADAEGGGGGEGGKIMVRSRSVKVVSDREEGGGGKTYVASQYM